MKPNLTLGSLFDGIGGFPYAAQLLGIEPMWASEIEKAPISITKRHFPGIKHLGDITKLNGAEIEPVDIITFGSPCQGLSVAGAGKGLEDERSGLFLEAIRIIREMREATYGEYPAIIVWENVPGAYSSNKGHDFGTVLQEIAETEIPMPEGGKWADAGMVELPDRQIAWRVLDAQYWGVPQRRRRIFLVCDFRGKRAREVLFEREGLSGDFTTGGTSRKDLARCAGVCALDADVSTSFTNRGGISCYIAETLRAGSRGTLPMLFDARGSGNGRIAPTMTGDHQNRITDYTAICIAGNTIDRQDHNGGNGAGAKVEVAYTLNTIDRHAVCYGIDSEQNAFHDKAGTLRAHCSGGAEEKVCYGFNPDDLMLTAPTLDANYNAKFGGDQFVKQWGKFLYQYAVRRLTPIECERLMGFPDDWTAYGHDSKIISDAARYRALGNSVAIPCVLYVLEGVRLL